MSIQDFFTNLFQNPDGPPIDNDAVSSALQNYGITNPDPALISIANTHGIPAAVKYADADPSDKVSSVLPADEIKAFGGDPDSSVADYKLHHEDKLNDAGDDAYDATNSTDQGQPDSATINAPLGAPVSPVAPGADIPLPPARPSDATLFRAPDPSAPQPQAPSLFRPATPVAPVAPPSLFKGTPPVTNPLAAPAPQAPATTGNLPAPSGPTNQALGYKSLLASGWSSNAAHAMVATLGGESGQSLNPNSMNNSGTENGGVINPKGSFGIGNWNGDRQADLLKFAQSTGGDVHSLDTQIAFVNKEARQYGIDPTSDADPAKQTVNMTGKYEIPAVNNGADRWNQYAQNLGGSKVADAGDDTTGTIPTGRSVAPGAPDSGDTPATNPSMYAKLATFLNGSGKGNSGGFADGLLGVASALAARDNPSQASVYKSMMTPAGSKMQAIGPSADGKGVIVFDPDEGTTKTIPIDGGYAGRGLPRGTTSIPAGPSVYNGPDGKPLAGNDLLEALPANDKAQVQAIIDGRQALPTGMSQRNPAAQRLQQLVMQVAPNYDAGQAKTRANMINNVANGKLGDNTNAINTALAHLDTLDETADKLGNTGVPFANRVANATQQELKSTPALQQFNTEKQRVLQELDKVYAGSHGSSAGERDELAKQIDASRTPEDLHAVVDAQRQLLTGKLTANQNQYDAVMGNVPPANPWKALQAPAQNAISNIEARRASAASAAASVPQAPQGGSQQPSAPAAPVVTSADQYSALPSGTRYQKADGSWWVKK